MARVMVKLYTRKKCPLCDQAKDLLVDLKAEHEFLLEEVDIYNDDALTEKYGLMIPVVEINGKEVQYGQIDSLLMKEQLRKEESFC